MVVMGVPKTGGAKRAAAKSGAGFPVVGLGASAGGLEAFEQFLRGMPVTSGMAFVLVQHLDPSHASILTEILQRSTAMPVAEAKDQVAVAPNHVYVIPPNRDMVIFRGALQLSVPGEVHGRRMPIDAFLRALAEDQGERAVGIILSGTGSDGTLGLRAIVGAGGISLVQEPATAKYDGMPASAIRAGYATHVLPVEQMPQALTTAMRMLAAPPGVPALPPLAASALNRVLMVLRSATGHDFSDYKKSTIGRRIERRMSLHDIDDKEVYARYLKAHPAELQLLFKELLINVTSFFRDPEAFVALRREILPQLLAGKEPGYAFRCWVAGGATGEEAYSIAMLLRECMDETAVECKVQIYSTDLDDDAIAVARAGIYPLNVAADVSPERLRRFFAKEDAGYRVKREIREMVVFATQNVIKDPPFTKLDLLSCRNLMIYLEPVLQDRLIPSFHYALKPDGVLFLSPSESIGNHAELFSAVNRKWKFYRAARSVDSTRAVVGGGQPRAAEPAGQTADEPAKATPRAAEINFVEIAKRLLLQSYAPASVLTTPKGEIVYVHGETGKYLRPAPGGATLNAVEMAREGLQPELRAAVQTAGKGTPILGQVLSVKTNGEWQPMQLSVRPLPSDNAEAGADLLLVSFHEVAVAPPPRPARRSSRAKGAGDASAQRVEQLERDLAYTRINLQATIEEQQASNEELKSTNEEMQSTNEELQSTNEELETSKEELQSVNEELVTVNTELQAKIDELAGVQSDLKNLLDNLNVGTIFLDDHLTIRRFTREAARVYRLVASDVGRPLADIKADLSGDDLTLDAQAVLDSLVPVEREVRNGAGARFLARIQPYRTLDNQILGVVCTFTDISKRIEAEASEAARAARALAESIVDTLHEPLLVLDGALTVISASRAFRHDFRVNAEETIGRPIYELGNRQWDIPALRELLETVLPRDSSFDDFPVEHDFPGIGHRRMLLDARRIVGTAIGTPLILLAIEDVSERRQPVTTVPGVER